MVHLACRHRLRRSNKSLLAAFSRLPADLGCELDQISFSLKPGLTYAGLLCMLGAVIIFTKNPLAGILWAATTVGNFPKLVYRPTWKPSTVHNVNFSCSHTR
jgi:hypothetical protein